MLPAWEEALRSLRGRANVIDIRNLGLDGGDRACSPPGAPGARGYEVLNRAFAVGLLVRVTGDVIALSPPLIVSPEQIARMVEMLGPVIDAVE